jgi:TetR/AcrR family transcriptional regulator, transcriptional repressor for nem operon
MAPKSSAAVRPRVFTAKGLATRARIVAAAAELMFDHGVAATAVEDVQRKASVSGSQMYHYFTDKQELVKAVVEYQAGSAVEFQYPLAPLDSLAALQRWAQFYIQGQRKLRCVGGCRLGSLVSQIAETSPDARVAIDLGFQAWEQPIVDGLRAMQNRGELRPDADPRRLGVAALAALQGGLVLSQVQRSVTPLEDSLGSFLDHIEHLLTSSR